VIVVRALGPVDVSVNGAPAPARLLWKKNLALLIYLARSPKRVRTREHLIGLLWGEKPEEKARHSLNEALHVLRLSAGDDGFESDTAQVRIAPGTVDLDTDTLEALAAAGDYARAAALINGDFLEGFSVRGASEFDNWLAAERQQWCRRSVEVLVHRAGQLLTAGNVAAAHDMVEHARELDWRPETAVRTALRTLALAGDRAGALALFDEFVARLQRELGAEPDAETSALAQRVRLERTWRLPKAVREAARASGSRRTPLVGRALELERLTDAWSACRARRRATVAVIEGDAGAGPKSSRLGPGSMARSYPPCARSRPTTTRYGAAYSGSRAADCSRPPGSPGLRRTRSRSCAARCQPLRPGAPLPRCYGQWRTSNRWSSSWMTRTGSTGSRCSRLGRSSATWSTRP